MQAEQFQIKQYALQDFQQNSMNKTPTQAVEFAKQNGLMSDVESIIGYMQDGVVNTLNGIGVGLGYKYAAEVETMLKQGNYSPAAILSKIVNYADVQQAMQSGSSNSWTIEEDKN
ncbi:MAG: hypothetical protein LBG59_07595 [Candidatus Peribacteria bacterium]|jgi:hypothetical protein|nr:hypothetical protein [Candidatus Peribacteria bacterium]